MKFTIKGFEVDLIEEGEGFTLKVKAADGKVSQISLPIENVQNELPKNADMDLLEKLGLSMKSIVQIANRVLGFSTSGPKIETQLPEIKKAALGFTSRQIKEPIWALMIAPIKLPVIGPTVGAVGINEENQLVILGFDEDAPNLYKSLASRGVRPGKVRLGILSFDLEDKKGFKKAFPEAEIQVDWQEFLERAPANQKEIIIKARDTENRSMAMKLMSKVTAPAEMFTYLSYDPSLWRAIRNTLPLKRIQADLRQKLKPDLIETADKAKYSLAWALMRLQYHWYKIPVNSDALKGLKYIAE
jgi:hypothetical protein